MRGSVILLGGDPGIGKSTLLMQASAAMAGTGQRVAYIMLDLTRRGRDVRAFIQNLESWLIRAAAQFGVEAGPREGRVGPDRGR